MSDSTRKVIGYSLGTIFIIWAAYTLISREEALPTIQWNTSLLSVFVLSVLIVIALNSVLIEECAQLVGRKVGFARAMAIGFVVTSANYFLPMRGGILIRLAAYSRLAGHDTVSLGSILTSSGLFVQLLFANVLAIIISVRMEIPYWYWVLLAGSLALSVTTYFAWPIIRRSRLQKYDFLRKVTEGSHLFYSNGGTIAIKVAVISMMLLIFTAVRYILIGKMLIPVEEVTISTALAIAAAASISSLISVTAGGFGIREGAVIVAAEIFGIPSSTGLLFALTDRFLVSLALIPFGIYSAFWAKRNSLLS